MRYLGASVSGVVAVPIEQVWELVSNPARHPELAGSGEVRAVEVVGGGPMGPGVVFRSHQRVRGLSYITASRTVIWDPPFRFAWRVGTSFAPGVAQIWMFNLSAVGGGTRVENGMAQIYALPTVFPFSLIHDELGRREAALMAPTLANLARALGAPAPTDLLERYVAPAAIEQLLPWPTMQGAVWEGGAGILAGAVEQATGGLARVLPRA
ncbi:MAG: DNA methyltransferase [Chloroflexales bacterium]|nr:DNA methyltransferase [Chloroflexales bacterium]